MLNLLLFKYKCIIIQFNLKKYSYYIYIIKYEYKIKETSTI